MTLYLNREYTAVYPLYVNLLINHNRLDETLKIIDIGLTISGIDVAAMTYFKGVLYDYMKSMKCYNTAVAYYTDAKRVCLNNCFMQEMDNHIKRVKDKKTLIKKSIKKEGKKKKEKPSA